jgi:hypothetical protein
MKPVLSEITHGANDTRRARGSLRARRAGSAVITSWAHGALAARCSFWSNVTVWTVLASCSIGPVDAIGA